MPHRRADVSDGAGGNVVVRVLVEGVMPPIDRGHHLWTGAASWIARDGIVRTAAGDAAAARAAATQLMLESSA